MTFLKVIYVLALGAFVAMLIGFGVAAFYEAPAMPAYPEPPIPPAVRPDPGVDPYQDPAYQARVDDYQKLYEAYEQATDDYRRNVFFIVSGCGLVVIVIGLLLKPGLEVIRAGLLLGGTSATLYGIAQYGVTSDKVRFFVIAVVLGILLFLGYRNLSDRKPRRAEPKGEGGPPP